MNSINNLLIVLISLIFGIFLESSYQSNFFSAATISLLAGVMFAIAHTKKINTYIQLLSSIVFGLSVGIFTLNLHLTKLDNHQKKLTGHYHYLVGIIEKREILSHPRYEEYLTIHLEGGKRAKFLRGSRLNSTIGAYFQKSPKGCVGSKILLSNITIKAPQAGDLENKISLGKQGIAGTIFISSYKQSKILEEETSGIFLKIWEWRQILYEKITGKLSNISSIFSGMLFFGNKQQREKSQFQDLFAQWGLSHYLARSGLHIVFLISIWLFLLRFIPIHICVKNFFLIALLIIYSLLSWDSVSFLRALFVFALLQGGNFLKKETNNLYLLTIVCTGMILYNPFLIFYLDFQLTFGLTFALIIFSKETTTIKTGRE